MEKSVGWGISLIEIVFSEKNNHLDSGIINSPLVILDHFIKELEGSYLVDVQSFHCVREF